MAFNAKLNFNGTEYDVLDMRYKLKRDVDSKGRPASGVYGGEITVRIESTEDTTVLEQMVSQFKPCSGSVTFKKGDEEAKMKELTWSNGYVVAFEESIDVNNSTPMTLSFTVSAQVITVGAAQFEQNWPAN